MYKRNIKFTICNKLPNNLDSKSEWLNDQDNPFHHFY